MPTIHHCLESRKRSDEKDANHRRAAKARTAH
jgi:hypothetical protein